MLAIVASIAHIRPSDARTQPRHWVGTWATSPAPPDVFGLSSTGVADRTLRQTVHTSIGGRRLRVRLSNAFGTAPIEIDAVAVAPIERSGARIAHPVTFAGHRSITVPAGARVISDAVAVRVPPESDVAVSIYLPGETGPLTWHRWASATTYVSVPGDHVADETMDAFPITATSFFLLDGLEVAAPSGAHAVVTLGDSITDGFASSVDENNRYPDHLARRLRARGRRMSVLNAGIGGNRLLNDSGSSGVSALARLDRDVLAQPGVRTVIVLVGINDIGFSEVPLDVCAGCVAVSAEELAAGYEQLIAQAHRHGVRVIGGTLLPFEGAFYHSPVTETKRQAVNDFIRHRSSFDGIVDFDAVMRDPAHPLRLRTAYDCGDHLHPSDAGYEAMAAAIDLRCLEPSRRFPRRGRVRTDCTVLPAGSGGQP